MLPAFNSIANNARQEETCEKLMKFLDYVESTWFRSSTWRPCNISVYNRLVRTNNDLEGYHNRLNSRCGSASKKKISIPNLIKVLYQEGNLVDFTYKMVSSTNVIMHRQKSTNEVQAKLCDLWDQYDDGYITQQELMEAAVAFSKY